MLFSDNYSFEKGDSIPVYLIGNQNDPLIVEVYKLESIKKLISRHEATAKKK